MVIVIIAGDLIKAYIFAKKHATVLVTIGMLLVLRFGVWGLGVGVWGLGFGV